MADEKITALTADILPAAADVVAIVIDTAGSPITRKMTHDDLLFGANGTPSSQVLGDAAAIGTALDAARSDHKHALSGFVATGTYSGNDGTAQSITGIGFTPKLLWIAKRYTVDATALDNFQLLFTTTDILDDNGIGGSITLDDNGASATILFSTGAVNAFGSDGFTVDDNGTNRDPNTDSVVYNYWAIG